LTLDGKKAATEEYVGNAIANIKIPETDLTDYATKKYVDDAVNGIEIPEVDFTGYATETYVDNKVADLVNSAPEALNTLGELATALENHEDAYDALLETVGGKATKAELEDLKTEISESIVSETTEFHIVDDNGNIVASIDENGFETTKVTAQDLSVSGTLNEQPVTDVIHTHSNKAILDSITGDRVEAWDSAESNANAYTDSAVEEAKTDAAYNAVVVLAEAQQYTDNAIADIKVSGGFSGDYNDLTNKPENVSDFNNDVGYLTSFTEEDPTVPNHVKNITTDDISNWNAKSEFDGDYNKLTNAPNISEDDSGDLVIADPNGNIIFRSDSDGFETTKLTAEELIVGGVNVGDAIEELGCNCDLSVYQTKVDESLETTDKTIVGAINEINSKAENGSGEGKAIIDVVALPTEDINEDVFYRLLTGTFVYNQYVENGYTVYCVEGLPEVGEPVTPDMVNVIAYYNVQDGDVYGYIDDNLSSATGVPAGWYTLAMLAPSFGVEWSGIITDILDDPGDASLRILLEYVIYSYKDGKWTSNKTIGWAGTGNSAEIFNHPYNVASGEASHAEGVSTFAIGNFSHSEGVQTSAEGKASHAEGGSSHAIGDYSHVEGNNTEAKGASSHAEGENTRANGLCSHAEGYLTFAIGDYQHAQGKNNILDTQNKYAHIVGNGTSDMSRSNAHTLDWEGNAWFAGNIYIGGTGQDDPDAKTLVQAVIDALPKYNGEVEDV
jgi:hypothetical protein